MDPLGIVAGVALGVLVCTVVVGYAAECCRGPKIKQSRSDNDLSSLNQDEV